MEVGQINTEEAIADSTTVLEVTKKNMNLKLNLPSVAQIRTEIYFLARQTVQDKIQCNLGDLKPLLQYVFCLFFSHRLK